MNKPLENPSRPTWPDWMLERFLLGELPADQARLLQERLESDAALARRLQAIRDEHLDLKAAHPAAAMAAGIERRLRLAAARDASQASVRSALAWSPFLSRLRLPQSKAWAPAFAMILILAILPFTPYSPFLKGDDRGTAGGEGATSGQGERIKGLKPRLLLHRKLAGAEGSVKLASGEKARAGDIIQIQYESAGRSHGALLSLDAEGKVTRHLPEKGDRSAALKAGGPVALDFAYELDDAAGWELFFLVTSDRPFDLGPVELALRGLRPSGASSADSLPLPKSFGQALFILVKEPGT